MYKSFEIANFRGFRNLSLKGLDHINLIAGKNNAGKTGLLEGLFLHAAAVNPALSLTINAFRGMERIALGNQPQEGLPWDSLFFDYQSTSNIQLKSFDRNDKSRTLVIRTEPVASAVVAEQTDTSSLVKDVLVFDYEDENGKKQKVRLLFKGPKPEISPVLHTQSPTSYLSARRPVGPVEDAIRFGTLQVEKKEGLLLESLRCVEPRLRDITVIVKAGEPTLHGDIGGSRLLPLPLLGEGTVRLATIVLAIATAPNGTVLIDEIENGLHHTVLTDVWRAIHKVASQFFVQIFATTHSLECIKAAHLAFKGGSAYDFRLHRIDRKDSVTSVITYDQDTLEASLESGLEIR